MDAATIIGSVGVALLLVAFLLTVLRVMSADALPYAALNFVGAALACYWALVAGFAIARKLRPA